MDRETFALAVYENWAKRFDCTVEDLNRPGTVLLPDEQFTDSGGVHIWQIGERAFVRVDPNVVDDMKRAQERFPAATALNADHIEEALGLDRIREIEDSLIHYLYPPDFEHHDPPSAIVVRQLGLGDAGALAEMKAACSPDEVDLGEVSVEDEIGFGCFDGETMVSVSTGFWLTGFMDIGVLTHPDYRGRGLGKAVVSALGTWCVERAIIAQYRCLVTNVGSHSIARALRLHRYFRQQSIYLTQGVSDLNR
jgi:GNAT superfamily N-acetyltransferase